MINFVGKVSWHLLPTSAAAEMGQPAGKTNVTDGEVACDTKVHPQLRWLRREIPKPGTKRARVTVPLFILIKGDRRYGCCVMSCCLIIPWEAWEKKTWPRAHELRDWWEGCKWWYRRVAWDAESSYNDDRYPLIQVGRGGIPWPLSLFAVTGIREESLEKRSFRCGKVVVLSS